MEYALRDSEERFHSMADAIPQLAWIANPDGYIFWYNKRWYEYTGTTLDPMKGWGWQTVVDPHILPEVMKHWKDSLTTGEPFEMEYPLRGADGAFRSFLSRVMPLKDSEGQVVQWFGTSTDISARKQMEEDLVKYADDLKSANADLESFSHSISHDFRNFLTILISMSAILDDYYKERLDDDGKICITEIRKTSLRMSQLITGLLNLSHASRQAIRKGSVNLSAIALAIVEELRKIDENKRVEFVIEPEMHATADGNLIAIVLSNLIGNACKFSSRVKEPRVEIGSMVKDTGRAFYVRDNGIGFSKESAEMLFIPFKRLHTGSTFEGHGLGLAIVKRIIEHHGGRIWAESEAGRGATFYFTLPETERDRDQKPEAGR